MEESRKSLRIRYTLRGFAQLAHRRPPTPLSAKQVKGWEGESSRAKRPVPPLNQIAAHEHFSACVRALTNARKNVSGTFLPLFAPPRAGFSIPAAEGGNGSLEALRMSQQSSRGVENPARGGASMGNHVHRCDVIPFPCARYQHPRQT